MYVYQFLTGKCAAQQATKRVLLARVCVCLIVSVRVGHFLFVCQAKVHD